MNYCLILVTFVTFGSFGLVKGTHEIYNQGYNDGYMDGVEDCRSTRSNTTHHLTYIINSMTRLEDVVNDRSDGTDHVLATITVLVIVTLVYILLVTLFMCCRKILVDVKEEEQRQSEQERLEVQST